MSGRISISSVDFAAFLFDFDRVSWVSFTSFLVRNWCGGRIVAGQIKPASGGTRLQVGNVLLDPLRKLNEILTVENCDEV
jgi:hypothetical protein